MLTKGLVPQGFVVYVGGARAAAGMRLPLRGDCSKYLGDSVLFIAVLV